MAYDTWDPERIALAYRNTVDDLYLIKSYDIHTFRQLINAQFSEISKIIYFDFYNNDPYPYETIDELEKDFRNKVIKVNTSGNESELWGKVYNLQFRAIHDWIHCVHQLDFNYRHETRAYDLQLDYSLKEYGKQFHYINWDLYSNILRSEIVYQAAVKEHFKEFHIDQKVILRKL